MLELEKKWLLKGLPTPEVMEEHGFTLISSVEIEQDYLSPTERIRANLLTYGGASVENYEYFTKTPVGEGACVEDKRELTHGEYHEYLLNSIANVNKVRITYKSADGLLYEFDWLDFEEPRTPIALLEVEFQDKYKTMEEVNANFMLPYFLWDDYVLLDVTGNDKFSNFRLADKVEDGIWE